MAITERNPNGTIKSSKLSKEEASRMGSAPKGRKDKLKSVDQILVEDGYPDPTVAPERDKLMAAQAAKGVVTAIKYFSTKVDKKTTSLAIPVEAGKQCPTCKQYVLADLVIGEELIGSVLEAIELERG